MLEAAINKLRSLKPTRETLVRFGLLVVVAAVFCAPQVAHAFGLPDIGDWLLGELATLFILGVRGVGVVMLMLVDGLTQVLQYTNFTNPGPTAVRVGWVVTRDLSNMFFIVMLMVIALSTVIGYPENYHYSKQLRGLLIVAVMINFSKTITGLIIDMGQVVMMTFVNGLLPAAGGNYLNAFQITKLLQLSKDTKGASGGIADSSGLLLGAILAFVMIIIATCVVLSLLVMMVWRIVYLWILIIMSPIAFLSRAVPPFAGKYAEWWKELKQYVIAGPTAAFFIWLALMVGQTAGADGNVAQTEGLMVPSANATSAEATSLSSANGYQIPTEASKTDVYLSMIIMTALLLAGLKEAQKSGFDIGVSKYLEGKMRGAGKAIGKFAYRQTGGRAVTAAKDVGRYVGGQAVRGVSAVGGKISTKVGGVVGKAGYGVGAVLAPASRAANLRQQAVKARASGNTAEAAKLEVRARRADTMAKIQAPLRAVAGAVTGTTLVAKGAEAHRSYQDEQRSKEMREAEKKLSTEDALAITTGQRPAKNQAQRNAAYKKAVESGRADQGIVAEGRKALASSDQASIDAYEKAAADKHGLFFKKDGSLDDEKRRAKLAEGEINFRNLSRSGKQAMVKDLTTKRQEDGTVVNRTSEESRAALRRNNVPADVISPEMAHKNPALAQYVLERTSTNPEERNKAMNRIGKDEQGKEIKMSDVLQQAAKQSLDETLADTKSSGRQIADAIKEAVLTGAMSAADVKALPPSQQQAVASGLNIPNLAKAADGMASDDPRLGAMQNLVGIVLANSNDKRQHDIQNNDRNIESNILPDDATIALYTPVKSAEQGGNNSGNGGQPAPSAPPPPPPSSQPPPTIVEISGASNKIEARISQINQISNSGGSSPFGGANEGEKAQLEALGVQLRDLSSSISFKQQRASNESDPAKSAQLEKEIAELQSNLRKVLDQVEKA